MFMRLDTENWKEYHLGDLFDKMYKAEAHVKGDYEFYDTLEGNIIETYHGLTTSKTLQLRCFQSS